MNAYSKDLRMRVLAAVDRGGPYAEVAGFVARSENPRRTPSPPEQSLPPGPPLRLLPILHPSGAMRKLLCVLLAGLWRLL